MKMEIAESQALTGAARQLIRAHRASERGHEIIAIMITACIAEGINERDQIIRTVAKLGGFTHAFVAYLLKDLCGSLPSLYRWWKDDAQVYHLHDDPALTLT